MLECAFCHFCSLCDMSVYRLFQASNPVLVRAFIKSHIYDFGFWLTGELFNSVKPPKPRTSTHRKWAESCPGRGITTCGMHSSLLQGSPDRREGWTANESANVNETGYSALPQVLCFSLYLHLFVSSSLPLLSSYHLVFRDLHF